MKSEDFTQEQLTTMSYAQAKAILATSIYETACFLERLEDAGKVRGNGHHMAQNLSKQATDLLRERWIDEAEAKKHDGE